MSVNPETGKHIPKNADKFEFDHEVISVFDNMARRSIVGYDLAYKMIENLANRFKFPKWTQVWDMGTTTGRALQAVRQGAGLNPYIEYHGLDVSDASVEEVQSRLPWAQVHKWDLIQGHPAALRSKEVSMINYGYTLQFINDLAVRQNLVHKAYNDLASGGVLVVLEKYRLEDDFLNDLAQDAYVQFRRDNGYSLEEIRAKTTALGASMWPQSPEFMQSTMKAVGFTSIHPLYRQLNFGGLIGFKK